MFFCCACAFRIASQVQSLLWRGGSTAAATAAVFSNLFWTHSGVKLPVLSSYPLGLFSAHTQQPTATPQQTAFFLIGNLYRRLEQKLIGACSFDCIRRFDCSPDALGCHTPEISQREEENESEEQNNIITSEEQNCIKTNKEQNDITIGGEPNNVTTGEE